MIREEVIAMKVKVSPEQVYDGAAVALGFVLFGFMIFCFFAMR
jgi:hypothetical protein